LTLQTYFIQKKVFDCFQDFSRLLQSLAVYDVCYLVLNLPAFVVPALSGDDINNSIIHAWPYISPLLQICLTGVFLTAKAVLENSLTVLLQFQKDPCHYCYQCFYFPL
jgi:hypothetical protein